MPLTRIGQNSCYYRLEGADGRPVLMLSHSLGLDHGMWAAQVADLSPYFQILRYDIRGHGASSAPHADYTIEELGRDALALADSLGIRQFAFCGLSLGGMIGQWLAANAPERLSRLVLANTTPRLADPQSMEARRRTVAEQGIAAVADVVMGRFFSPHVLASSTPAIASARRTLLATDPAGYAGCCAAIRDMDHTSLLSKIRVPTLVICGDLDVPMPWLGNGDVLARAIEGARAVHLPAAHISNLERPRSFSAALLDFLIPASADTLQSGFAVRRDLLGDAHVDRAMAGATDLTRDFQELITRYAWGTIWARPGLDHHTRRLLVLAITGALGRADEVRLHLRTGLARELEPCDVKEVFLQVAIYAGVPVANAAFKIAAEEQSAADAAS
jgi:3-oxoadipate enol-lactonase / 4-carboxymuconolactone decarboxylase